IMYNDTNAFKNVVSVIDYHNNSNRTGVATYIEALKESLKDSDDFVFNIIYLDDPEDQDEISDNGGIYRIRRKSILLSQNDKAKYWAERIISRLQVNIGSIQTNHIFHFNWIVHFDVAYYLKQLCCCKILLTVHYIPWKNFVSINYPLFYKFHNYSQDNYYVSDRELMYERTSYHVFDQIITVTQDAKDNLTKLFRIPEKKIKRIYNGKNVSSVQTSKEQLREKYFIAQDEVVLLYVGAVNKRKGVKELMESFGSLVKQGHHNIRLILAGSGQIDRFLSDSLTVFSKITWVGFQPESVINELIALSDIGILLSYTEQCSYAIIEMMANKLPVVVTDIDGLMEMVTHGRDGYKISVEFTQDEIVIDQEQLSIYLTKLIEEEN